ncbi:YNFM family putative membrane transporter [Paucimonas lemoignei]|uniref:YNFM family putative membrane transporter n=2 Tax=Paucimonas lemoignei TaxID=29443 RepID=A0A4R3HX30_PAULE|nr:YNFM family putative membrane transporter [Paucimonas lemoignei]
MPAARIRTGTREFRQTNRAMFLGGFSTFALLYSVQPLLPLFAQEFGLSPMHSSWALSASTGALAVCLLLASVASDRLGRKNMMCLALLLSALLNMACAFAHSFTQLVILRALLGVTLAGLPAVALAYLGEEIDAPSLGYSVGLYIAGTALGGMTGRVATSFLSDYLTWRPALAVIGGAALLATAEFWRILPQSNHFKAGTLDLPTILGGARRHFQDGGLPWFFCLAFLLMGSFVSVYNYLGFRLAGAEFGLRHSEVSLIFSLYLMGMFSSVWMGKLADRFGRRRVLWTVIAVMLAGLLLTLSGSLVLIIAGIALFTFGFFGGHSIASSWVGRRAKMQAGLASSLYLFFYYLGSSLIGSFSGLMWETAGWPGVVAVLAACLILALWVAVRLRKLAPLAA